jgi:hypothetical protein
LYSDSTDLSYIENLNFDEEFLEKIEHLTIYCYAWARGTTRTGPIMLRAKLLANIFHTGDAAELTVICRAWVRPGSGHLVEGHLQGRTVLESLPAQFELRAEDKR